jgi:hypothetical protein
MIGSRILSRSRSLPKLVDKRDLGMEEGKTRSVFVVRSSHSPAYSYVTRKSSVSELFLLLLLSNGKSWIYSISLLASQYSFGTSLEVWSSFGHTDR